MRKRDPTHIDFHPIETNQKSHFMRKRNPTHIHFYTKANTNPNKMKSHFIQVRSGHVDYLAFFWAFFDISRFLAAGKNGLAARKITLMNLEQGK